MAVLLLRAPVPAVAAPVTQLHLQRRCSEGAEWSHVQGKACIYFYCLNSKRLAQERINGISNSFSDRILPFHITSAKGVIKAITANPLCLDLIALKFPVIIGRVHAPQSF